MVRASRRDITGNGTIRPKHAVKYTPFNASYKINCVQSSNECSIFGMLVTNGVRQ